MSFLVTGALGFIGSNFVNYYNEKYPEIKITILDKKDYCSSLDNIINKEVNKIVIGNIGNDELVKHILYGEKIDTIVHFAAESHVDNSFNNSLKFTENNVLGTHKLLETVRKYHEETSNIKKFIHISTDEVYGEVLDDKSKTEQCVLNPTNPYAASKAATEFIVKSYFYSYKIPIIITRSNNVYGKNQYPEKIIPKFICQLLDDKPLTIHGEGKSKRTFIHVDDVCNALDIILLQGEIGHVYNISALNNEYSVLEIVDILLKLFEKSSMNENMIYCEDRNFNDLRYYTSGEKLDNLGWKPNKTDFILNLKELIEWYKTNRKIYSY